MIPNDRETEFGTVNEALKLRIYFEGQELDKYETYFGAISSKYQPNTKLNLQFTSWKLRKLSGTGMVPWLMIPPCVWTY